MVNAPPKRKLSQAYNPTTFLERGVLVPFTTPLLAGTRARTCPSEREGLDLIVPNPSGGPGVYILPWDGVRELCRPTVHDIKLHEKVAEAPSVSPASIRQAARAIAAEGLAGREARAAAEEASQAERQDHVLVNFLLVMAFVHQIEPRSSDSRTPPATDRLDEMQERAKRAVAAAAPRVGKAPDVVAAQLDHLAAVFDGVGVEPHAARSRLGRTIEALRQFHANMVAWSSARADESGEQAAFIASVAELTLDWAQRTLADAVGLTANVAHLLRRWETEPELISRRAARLDWLLDGWQQIGLMWETASGPDERRAVLPELVALVPLIPREASEWVGVEIDGGHPARRRRVVGQNQDWRTGNQVLDLVARNERVRSLAT